MGNATGDILPLAIGVAISPVSIIAVILMLYMKLLYSRKDRLKLLSTLPGYLPPIYRVFRVKVFSVTHGL